MQIRKSFRLLLVLLISLSLSGVGSSAHAVVCPPTNLDGNTVASISIGKTAVPIKRVDYPKSGVLDPPRSPQFAGVSIRHRPLSSIQGSSLIVWHYTYNGCKGTMNPLLDMPRKGQIEVVDEKGKKTKYQISKKMVVDIGKYDADWFRLNGSRQLVFVTCTGKVVNGKFTKNAVVIATPL